MSSENQKPHEIIGEFVAKVNSIEFFVNILLEKIIAKYSSILDIQDAADYTIDHIEEQSIKIRINLIIILLTMTGSDQEIVRKAIAQLKDFIKFYNKSIRDVRDFVAHNPYVRSGDLLVISSRRYKGKLNSLKIVNLKSYSEELTPKIVELFKVMEQLSKVYPAEIKREF